MDFDPRDYSDERDPRGRDWDDRDRDEDDALTIGRGSSSHSVNEHHPDDLRGRDDDQHADHDDRQDERDAEAPDRGMNDTGLKSVWTLAQC